MPRLRLLAPVDEHHVTGARGDVVTVSDPDLAARLIADGRAVPAVEGRRTAVDSPRETR